jgi:hypothetical protein
MAYNIQGSGIEVTAGYLTARGEVAVDNPSAN